jgi:nucleoid DNA-binding protein
LLGGSIPNILLNYYISWVGKRETRDEPQKSEQYAALAIAKTKKKGAFALRGIGKSVLAKRKTRIGRNPQTGKEIKIPEKTIVKVRPAKAFEEAIIPPK